MAFLRGQPLEIPNMTNSRKIKKKHAKETCPFWKLGHSHGGFQHLCLKWTRFMLELALVPSTESGLLNVDLI